ncbi:MAG: transcriptional repressor LexA [Elusimicrobia bacterium]|nr:transcriptional repressor LexA [Candidatus Liberimonas magnetica]
MDNIVLTEKEKGALRSIRSFLLNNGRMPSVRELMNYMDYKYPRSVSLLFEQLTKKGILKRKPDGKVMLANNNDKKEVNAQTVNIPLLGSAPCGTPNFAEENIEAVYPVSVKLAPPPYKYFLLRAKGDSMNEKSIDDGDLLLVRQQQTAKNGDCVVALIDGESTIKEFHKTDNAIILKPRSKNDKHKAIILTRDLQVQGVVVTTIKGL